MANFEPDWISPPGDTIRDLLSERGWTSHDLARALSVSEDMIAELVVGERVLDAHVAQCLHAVFGAPAGFWLARENQYRQAKATAKRREADNYVDDLPLKRMQTWGWLPKTSSRKELQKAGFDFFGVTDGEGLIHQQQRLLQGVAFKRSAHREERAAIAAWLRQGEILARSLRPGKFNPHKLERALPELRALTRVADPAQFVPKLQQICADSGVAVIVLRAPTGCPASGAVRIQEDGSALLLLSFRFLTDDHFWFALFHEIAHLLLHADRRLLLDEHDEFEPHDAVEDEANAFSADTLVPRTLRSELEVIELRYIPVMRFARRIGVSPGIVVGQLQHMGRLRFNQLARLRRRYKWHD